MRMSTRRPHGRLAALGMGVALAISVVAPAAASVLPSGEGRRASADTPAPTPRPEKTPRPTKRPTTTPAPEVTPGPGGFTPAAPGIDTLRVGYREGGIKGRLPLVVAAERGYFRDAGFDSVELIDVEEPIPGLFGGQLDIGVVDLADAADGVAQGLPLAVLASFHGAVGDHEGADGLAASADLVASDPATITAFLTAYIRALQDIADPAAQDAILELADRAGIQVNDEVRAAYASRVAEFAPFDGGFGEVTQDLSALLAWPALLVAQSTAGVPANPPSDLLSPPVTETIRVAVPAGDADGALGIAAARDALGAGALITAIEPAETEAPLDALLEGSAEVAVVPLADAASAIAGGQPIALIAGGRNAPDGEGTADALAVTQEFLAADPGVVTAFLLAYLDGLQSLAAADAPGAAAYAPFDGGFGERDDEGGLGALEAAVGDLLGPDLSPADLLAWPPLVVAQTALGLPANPVASVMGPVGSPQPSPAASAVAP